MMDRDAETADGGGTTTGRRWARRASAALYRLLPLHVATGDLEGTSAEVRRALPANVGAIAANGLFFPAAGKIVSAGLLLTWFVSELTPVAWVVGLIVPIQYGLSLIAQPAFAQWLGTRPRRAPAYAAQAAFRGAVWGGLAAATWLAGADWPRLLLGLFFAAIVLDAFAAAIGNIAFGDVLAKVVPPRLRGRTRSWRGVFGALTAAAVALILASDLGPRDGLGTFAWLFVATGLLYAVGGLTFAAVDEPLSPEDRAAPAWGDLVSRVRRAASDRVFLRFVLVEAALVPLAQGLPYFTLLGKRHFGLSIDALGVLVLVDALSPVIGNYLWGRLADARGNRSVLFMAALGGLAAPACAGILLIGGDALPRAAVLSLFAAIVFGVSLASTGVDLATKNYVLELAPEEAQRPMYIGVNDTLVGLPTMLLAGSGIVIDLAGFAPVFAAMGLLAIAAVSLLRGLPSYRPEVPGA